MRQRRARVILGRLNDVHVEFLAAVRGGIRRRRQRQVWRQSVVGLRRAVGDVFARVEQGAEHGDVRMNLLETGCKMRKNREVADKADLQERVLWLRVHR